MGHRSSGSGVLCPSAPHARAASAGRVVACVSWPSLQRAPAVPVGRELITGCAGEHRRGGGSGRLTPVALSSCPLTRPGYLLRF